MKNTKILVIFLSVIVLSMPAQNVFAGSFIEIKALDFKTDVANNTVELDGARGVATFTISGSTYAIVASEDDDGVQIIDISDTSNIVLKDVETDGANGFTELDGASGVATFTNSTTGKTFAIVAANADNGVQIIDISDPTAIAARGAVSDGVAVGGAGTPGELEGARGVDTFTISGRTYAIVASQADNGVQILDISSMDESVIIPIDSKSDGSGSFTELEGAHGVDTFTIGSSTYAIVVSVVDDGVQIINLSTPSAIAASDVETDGANGFTTLNGASGVATFTYNGNPYAIVASVDDDGVQIINLSTPTAITAQHAATDNDNGFSTLDGARGVATFTISGSTYAIVASVDDDGVQLIDISDPSKIVAIDAETDGNNSFTELDGASGVATFTISGSTYAIVASSVDDGVQMMRFDTIITGGSDKKYLAKPTFGISHSTNAQTVTDGFSFNNNDFTITDNWHTDFDKQNIKVGSTNVFSAKVSAPYNLSIQEFLFGINEVGMSHNAELGIEVYYDTTDKVKSANIVQNTKIVNPDTLMIKSEKSKCQESDAEPNCITTTISVQFLEPLQHDVMAIKAIDRTGRTQITYLNEGFEISGKSLNPMLITMIPGPAKYEGLIQVTQHSKYSPYWSSDDGRIFQKDAYGGFAWINQSFERMPDSGSPVKRDHSEFGALVDGQKHSALEYARKMYPNIYDEPFDKINNIVLGSDTYVDRVIDYKKMKVEEHKAQIIMDLLTQRNTLEKYRTD